MSLETECRDFSDADTSVYWDVEDFPVDSLDELRSKIEAAREKIGCRGGDVSITAYGEEKPDEELARYKDAGFTFVPIGDYERRFNRMRLDLGLWKIDHHHRLKGKPTNLMVITKFITEDTDFQEFLECLYYSHYYVVLLLPSNCDVNDTPVPRVNKVWYWETLLDGGDPLSRHDSADLIALGGQVCPSLQSLFGRHVRCGGDHPCPTCEEDIKSASKATMSNNDFSGKFILENPIEML
ncbi:unnamed protein product [Microthlaspi erraticum]|uniref:NYN domain-containing protein n=1 Tax=Microthlaspi erraticum TaxID=1685480 RepID=A0A6D2HMA2_9BRAS|nr:unnamed protein product [Microthlaspi erraticum]